MDEIDHFLDDTNPEESSDVMELADFMMKALEEGDHRGALDYWELLGKDIDPLKRKTGFYKAVQSCVLDLLQKTDVHGAYEVISELGEWIDCAESIKKGYLHCLTEGNAWASKEIMKLFGSDEEMSEALLEQHLIYGANTLRGAMIHVLETAQECGHEKNFDRFVGDGRKTIDAFVVKNREDSDEG